MLPGSWLPNRFECEAPIGTQRIGGRIVQDLSGSGEAGFQEYQTHWKFRQSDVFSALPARLQNFFLYAPAEKVVSLEDPIAYLSRPPRG